MSAVHTLTIPCPIPPSYNVELNISNGGNYTNDCFTIIINNVNHGTYCSIQDIYIINVTDTTQNSQLIITFNANNQDPDHYITITANYGGSNLTVTPPNRQRSTSSHIWTFSTYNPQNQVDLVISINLSP